MAARHRAHGAVALPRNVARLPVRRLRRHQGGRSSRGSRRSTGRDSSSHLPMPPMRAAEMDVEFRTFERPWRAALLRREGARHARFVRRCGSTRRHDAGDCGCRHDRAANAPAARRAARARHAWRRCGSRRRRRARAHHGDGRHHDRRRANQRLAVLAGPLAARLPEPLSDEASAGTWPAARSRRRRISAYIAALEQKRARSTHRMRRAIHERAS